jgi:hypothetical protein
VTRIAARLALVLLALCAGCGGGNGESEPDHRGVEAFPDVLEIARAELGETAPLVEVRVTETEVSFVHFQIGHITRVKYNPAGVFTGNDRVTMPLNFAASFAISQVPADAPQKLLSAIREREAGELAGLTATLARDKGRVLVWRVSATVGGAPKEYEADLNGTLRG